MSRNVSVKSRWLDAVQSTVSLGLVLNLFLMRPAALGQSFTWLAMALTVVLVGLYWVCGVGRKAPTQSGLRFEMTVLFLLVTLYWLYEGPISLVFARTNLDFLVKEFVSTIVILVPYGLLLLGSNANRLFFRQFCTVMSLLGLSTLVTVVLTSLLGSRDPLFLMALSVKGYSADAADPTAAVGAVYFPLSMLYTDFVTGAVSLGRYCGFFREAGIFQAVACFCLAYEAFTRRSKFVMFGIVAGSIFTFSSLGVVLLAATLGLIFLFGARRVSPLRVLIAVAALSAIYPLALYTPYIGLNDKLDTHGTSLTDRSAAISQGLEQAGDNPFGYGMYGSTGDNAGICLLSSLGALGVLGFLCQVVILSGWRPGITPSWKKMAACLPILITALVSQPIAGEPVTYILMMAFLPRVRRQATVAGMGARPVVRPSLTFGEPIRERAK